MEHMRCSEEIFDTENVRIIAYDISVY